MTQETRGGDGRGLFTRGMRLVVAYVRMHPRPFLVSVVGSLVFAVSSVLLTTALARATDKVLRPSFSGPVPAGSIWLAVLALMTFGVGRALGIMFRRYYSGVAGERVMATLRNRVADRYVIAMTLLAMGSLLHADPWLALIGLILFPSLALMNRSFAKRMEEPARSAQEDIGEVSAVAHESIDGALVVKTLGREDAETERLAVKARALRDDRVRGGYVRATFEAGLDALPTLATALLLAVGSWRVAAGAITVGDLIGFVALFGLLSWPMRFIGWILAELPRAVVGYARLEEVFRTSVTLNPPEHPEELPKGPLGIEVLGVRHLYDGVPILDGVTFDVQPMESVAIVGPTGVGKSTLAQLLVRLADPEQGRVLVGGVDVRDADPVALRRDVSIVFQESFLFATTVRENIALDADAAEADVVRSAMIASADRFIRELPQGYDTVVGERGYTLSGGQRQRVALARALVRAPRVLILDDATSSVDPTIEADILAALRRELSTTLIVVAYRLSTIRLADRVIFLEDGVVKATGPHEDLLARQPGYASIIHAYERAERTER